MEMEVVATMHPPAPSLACIHFNFDNNCSSPYITTPSSPQPFGFGRRRRRWTKTTTK
ncbi:hypothetical protein SESBI_03330 [Sesbania bispinosa]|nr:hypothetical protein SESBI_03330 [Sesbania bispinosa]